MKKLLFALMVVAAMAAHASVWYVSPTGSDETGTGASDAPFATIANAVDRAGDGDVIRVAAGENGVASAITVAKGVTIVGEDGAIVCSTNALSSATGADAMYSRSIFLLNHADAVLTNLVICGKGAMGSPNDYGRGVTLNGGGYVLGCTITNNYCKSGNGGSDGAGVCLRNGGTVRGCTISSNRAMMGNGGNVCISTSGLVENCVIESGNNDGSNGIRTGGAYMTGGTLRYCLLRYNRGSGYGIDRGADIFASGGTVDHCTVTANANGSKASAFGATYFEGSSTVVSNCIFYGNACPDWKGASPATFTAVDNLTGDTAMPGEGNLVADPWFVDAANGDYRVRPGPGAGKGYLPDAVGATVPDCGAYVASRNGTIDTDTVTLTAVLTGAAVGDTTFTWTVSNRTSAAVQTVSGTGADYATRAFTCGAGLYDVTLAVDATGVGSASRTFEGLFRVSSSVLRPTAGVLNALSDALLEAAGGTTIILTNGWYSYEGTIMLDKKITIVSENGPGKTHVVALSKSGVTTRPVVMSDADAVLSGLDFSAYAEDGTAGSGRYRGAVYMTAGTVTNCTFRDFYAQKDYDPVSSGMGGAINASAALITACTFTDNRGSQGGGVYASSGTRIVRCRFLNNNGGDYGGGFRINSGSLAYSCLVAYNRVGAFGGAAFIDGSTTRAYNCTFVNNTMTSRTSDDMYGVYYSNWASAATSLVNCLGYGNYVSAPDPGFRNLAEDDYHLLASSDKVDSGTTYAGIDDMLDLDGNPRVKGTVDYGCYERDKTSLDCYFTVASRNNTPEEDSITFATDLTGAAVADTTYTWSLTNLNGGAAIVVSGTGAAYAAPTVVCSTGTYDVTLTVSAAGATPTTASYTRKALFTVARKVVVEAGVLNALTTAAAAAEEGDVLFLTNGWYSYEGTLTLNKKIGITSENGPEKTHVVALSKSGVTTRPIVISDADAVLSGVDVSAYKEDGTAGSGRYRGGVYMTAGTIRNCTFRDFYAEKSYDSAGQGNGGAVCMTAGLVTDCVITNCQASNGGGIHATGTGIVDEKVPSAQRCRIVRCQLFGGRATYGGGFYITSGAAAYSCLVAYNTTGYYGAGAYVFDKVSFVYNCTLVKNTSSKGQDTYGVCYNNSASAATSLFNCLGWGNGDAAEDPGFRNPEKGNFHLKSSSPYVDTATVYGWMSGDVDLDGKPRIQGRRPDYGCYERMVGGFSVIVR